MTSTNTVAAADSPGAVKLPISAAEMNEVTKLQNVNKQKEPKTPTVAGGTEGHICML